MLNVLDFSTGVTHAVSLTSDSNAFQVISALSRNKLHGGNPNLSNTSTNHSMSTTSININTSLFVFYTTTTTTNNPLLPRKIARRLRSDTRPLNLVNHMRHALLEPYFLIAPTDVDEIKFKSKLNIELDVSESGFFSLIERLTLDDWCGYVDSKEGNQQPYRRTWWVLCGEKLWYSSSHLDSQVIVLPLAQNRVLGREYEVELHTALSSFQLRFSDPREATRVYQLLHSRIISATENEFLRLAECLISDMEQMTTYKNQSLINRASSSMDGLLETLAGEKLFARFTRRHGYEPLLLFYLDAVKEFKSHHVVEEEANLIRLFKRFSNLSRTYNELQEIFGTVTSSGNSTSSSNTTSSPSSSSAAFITTATTSAEDLSQILPPTVHSLEMIIEQTHKVLVDGPYALLMKDTDGKERLLQELPLWKSLEE
jgi:hypothetical protein